MQQMFKNMLVIPLPTHTHTHNTRTHTLHTHIYTHTHIHTHTHTEEVSGIYITSLNSTGAAATDGRIHVGDRIVRVDGHPLRGLENMEAAAVLRNSGNPVKLVLGRRKRGNTSPPGEGRKERWREEEGEGGGGGGGGGGEEKEEG